MLARAAALHGLRHLPQRLQGRRAAAVQDVRQTAGRGGQAQLAGAALAGGLGGQPVRHPQRLAQRAGLRADRQDRARAERAAHRGQGRRARRRPRARPPRRSSCRGSRRSARPGAAAGRRASWRTYRSGTPGGHLDDHRARDRAGDGEHDRARLVVQPGVAVALGRRCGRRWRAGRTSRRWTAGSGRRRRRCRRRRTLRPGGSAGPPSTARMTAERLAGDHALRGALTIRARSCCPRRSDRPRSASAASHGHLRGVTGDRDDQRAGAERLGGQQGAVQDQVRGAVQQDRVLAAGGFALAAVDHDDGPHPAPDRGLGDGAQLLARRGSPRRRGRAGRCSRRAAASCSPAIGSSGPCTFRCMARSRRSTRSKPEVSWGRPTTRTSGTSGRAGVH